jgi:hypothetical protein
LHSMKLFLGGRGSAIRNRAGYCTLNDRSWKESGTYSTVRGLELSYPVEWIAHASQ